jgi:hypothetical protein
MRILIVEDEPAHRQKSKLLLSPVTVLGLEISPYFYVHCLTSTVMLK